MRKIVLWLCIFAFIISSIFIGDIIMALQTKIIPPYGSVILFDNKGVIITEKGKEGGFMIPYTGSLEKDLIKNIIEIEDNRFWKHSGIDLYGKLGSIKENIKAGGIIRGGSTITEQYIKNVYYTGNKRTFVQKIREGIAALILEKIKTKEEILRGYLDNIYLGNTIYGIAGAERRYYNGRSLSKDDILDLITRINSPNIREENRGAIIEYREKVRRRLNIGNSKTSLFENISKNSIDRYPNITLRIKSGIESYCNGDKALLLKWTNKIYSDICNSPLVEMRLSLDSDLMEFSRTALEGIIGPLMSKNVTNGSIYIYNPETKKILAYIANRQSSNKGDYAIDMIKERRSVGSILKPFIYLLAFEMGNDNNDFILDDTRVYPTGYSNKGFIPVNYVEKSYGPVRLREALGNSLNSSAVRLSEEIGIGKIYDFFRQNNLDLNHDAGYYGYGISLGTVELSLENIVESYANLIDRENPNLYLLEEILKDSSNRSKTFGISSILNTSIPLAVKTGTSTDFRDNWTISYSKDAIIGIWVGNSDASPMNDISGVSGAGPLWHAIAEYMINRRMIESEIDNPPFGLENREICLDKNCYQKEIRLSKKKGKQKSRPINHLYYESDFVTRMTSDEKKRWNIKSD